MHFLYNVRNLVFSFVVKYFGHFYAKAWSELNRSGGPKKRHECINQLQKKHKRMKLQNTVSIDSIYEKNFLSLNSVLEAVVVDAFILPGILLA